MSVRTIAIAVVAAGVLTGGAIWAMRGRPDRQVQETAQLQDKSMDLALPAEQRQEAQEQLKQKMEQLTPEQREEARRQMGASIQKKIEERVDRYFAAPVGSTERTACLDKDIDDMLQLMKEYQARRKQQGDTRSGSRSENPSGDGATKPDGAGEARGKWAKMSPDQKAQARKSWLDKSTPEQRAKFQIYMQDVLKRMAERKLPLPGFGLWGR